MTAYGQGFQSLDNEITAAALPVDGVLPGWLGGTLTRNGPAIFDRAGRSLRHWFDGQAMLHAFTIEAGAVTYTNQLVDTPSLRSLRERGRIGYAEFATDPCGSLFSRFFTRFTRKPSTNPCVNVALVAGRPVAVTEVPLAVEFDPGTLDTVGVVAYDGGLDATVTTAHPHATAGGAELVNFVLKFGRRSEYAVYRQPVGGGAATVVGRYAVDRPGYVHSFAVTERHAILAVFPFVVNPLALLLRNRPFIENYRWRPEEGVRIVVMDLVEGGIRTESTVPAAFAFHHINAFDDGDRVVMDLCAFPDAEIVSALYLDRLRAGHPVPMARPTRYDIPLDGGAVQVSALSTEPLELPRIHYGEHNGRAYRYAYGVGGAPDGRNFLDRLVKLDVVTGATSVWREPGCYPGEPVFVAAPDATGEDHGVLLSIVLDTTSARSFLLVLAADSFRELARAVVPHAIPFGFHGQFSAGRTAR